MQFAYIDLVPLDALFGGTSDPLTRSARLLRQPNVAQRLSLLAVAGHYPVSESTTGSYYHCFLAVHAFIANPCAPGETAELFFSLFNRAENRFVTEEFCLVLNHLGAPARDPEHRLGRLRTMFTDLKYEDLTSSTFLVCRIVRNGALRTRTETSGGIRQSLQSQRKASIRRSPLDNGTLRSSTSVLDNMTDDSFSITSGFGGHRSMTIDSTLTSTASVADGRPSFRRPLGCAVLEMTQLSKLINNSGDRAGTGSEFTMPIFVPKDEGAFVTLHEDIIHGRTKDVASSSR